MEQPIPEVVGGRAEKQRKMLRQPKNWAKIEADH